MDTTTVTVHPFGSERSCTLDLAASYHHFQNIPDLRDRRGVRYPLALLLTIALWAKLAGATQLRAIAEWARERQGELAERFDVPRPRMPHPTTWSRVFGSAVAVDALEQQLALLLASPPSAEEPLPAQEHVALDGKTLRGTIPQDSTHGVHLLSAYAVSAGRVLDQEAVESKENELVAAPRLLARLPLRGRIVSGDAMFAQRSLSTQIVEAGGHYCWMVKENQPTLLDDLRLLFTPRVFGVATGWSAVPLDFVVVEQHEKGHGRREYRRLTVSSELVGYSTWPYLAQVFEIVRISQVGRQISREERYSITSASAQQLSARRLMGVVRGHWRKVRSLRGQSGRSPHGLHQWP